jgi:hypothetical protein
MTHRRTRVVLVGLICTLPSVASLPAPPAPPATTSAWDNPAITAVVGESSRVLERVLARALRDLAPGGTGADGATNNLAYARSIIEGIAAQAPFVCARDRLDEARTRLQSDALDFAYHMEPLYASLTDLVEEAPQIGSQVMYQVRMAGEKADEGDRASALHYLDAARDLLNRSHAYLPLATLRADLDAAGNALGHGDRTTAIRAMEHARDTLGPLPPVADDPAAPLP